MPKKKIEIFDAYGDRIYVLHTESSEEGLSGKRLDDFHVPYAKLPAMNFSNCQMYWPLFEGADLSFSNFESAVLAGANFQNATLRHVSFKNARFVPDAMEYRGSLSGADLTDATLENTVLEGVEYDGKTIFPEGFDPLQHGLKKLIHK